MKRFLASALVLGVISGTGFVGCAETAKEEVKEVKSDAGGKTTTTESKEVKSTGDAPPANSAGETGKTPVAK